MIRQSSLGCSIPMWFLFPGHPTRARFFNDQDKYSSLARIRLNQTGTQSTRMYRLDDEFGGMLLNPM